MKNITDEDNQELESILNDEITTTETDEETASETSEENLTRKILNTGDSLSCDELYKIMGKEKSKMVVFIGPAGSGKTTIETSLYQMFLKAPLGDFYFAGSNTLQGYESRAFYTRLSSHGSDPKTLRTNVQLDRPFLHLRLWNPKQDKINNFLFADLSGEALITQIGQVENIKKEFPFIKRADYIIGVLDGELLKNVAKKNVAIEQIIQLIRTIYDANLISNGCVAKIIFSKYDELSKETNSEELIKSIKQRMTKRLESMFKHIEYHCIAAMPKESADMEIGYGLEALLMSFVKKYPFEFKNEKIHKFRKMSEFDKLDVKLGGGE